MLSDRFFALRDCIRDVYTRISNDDLLQTLANNPFSESQIPYRVHEIFSEVIENEREAYISMLLEEKERISLENTQNLEKIANLLKEIAIKESKMKQTFEKFEEISKNNRFLESKIKENEVISFETTRDKEEIMRLSAETATLKVRLREKEVLLEELHTDQEALLIDNRTLEQKVASFAEKERAFERRILEFEGRELALKNEGERLREKCDGLNRKIANDEREYREEMGRIQGEMRAEFEGVLAGREEEIGELKRILEEVQAQTGVKLSSLKGKNTKLKENIKVFEKAIRDYESLVNEGRRKEEDLMRKLQEQQTTTARIETRNEECAETNRQKIEDLRRDHKIVIEKMTTEDTKKQGEIASLKEEKTRLEQKIADLKKEHIDKLSLINRDSEVLKARVNEQNKEISSLRESLESNKIENEVLVKSNKQLEMSVFEERRLSERKESNLQNQIREKDLKIESLEATSKIYKENEEFLRKKADYQESLSSKRKLDSDSELKRLKDSIELLKLDFQRKDREWIQKTEQWKAERERLINDKSEDKEGFKKAICEKEQVLEGVYREKKELEGQIREFKENITQLARENNDKKLECEELGRVINNKEKEREGLENRKGQLERELETLEDERKRLEDAVNELEECIRKMGGEFNEYKEKNRENLGRAKASIKKVLASLRKDLGSIKNSQNYIRKEALSIAEGYFLDFMRVSNGFTEKKLNLQEKKFIEERKAFETLKNHENIKKESSLIENRVTPLEKALNLEKAKNFDLEAQLLQRNHEISTLNNEIQELKSTIEVKSKDLEVEKDEKLRDFETFERKLQSKEQEIFRKTQEVSMISGFLVKLKDEILMIMALEKDKQKRRDLQKRKEFEGLLETIRTLQKSHGRALGVIRKELEDIEMRNKEEKEGFARIFERLKGEIGEIQEELDKANKELKIKAEVIRNQKDLMEEMTAKNENLQAEIGEKSMILMENNRSFWRESKRMDDNAEVQRKLANLMEVVNGKNNELAKISQENDNLAQTVKGLQMQLNLKTQHYERLKEESLLESQKNREELMVWKRMMTKKQAERDNKKDSGRVESSKLSQQIKDLHILEKSFNK